MKKSKGLKCKTRKKLSVRKRERGKLKISDLLKNFRPGDKVIVKPHAGHQRTLPNRRFYGRVGTVKSKVGACYSVLVRTGGMVKELVVSPAHLKELK